MSRSIFTGPKLPHTLLDQVGTGRVEKQHLQSRKDKRKQDRALKKPGRSKPATPRSAVRPRPKEVESEADGKSAPASNKKIRPTNDIQPVKSIVRPTKQPTKLSTKTHESESEDDTLIKAVAPKVAKIRFEEEDAEIARLEKKLGVKRKKSKSINDDGLDWLLGDASDSENEGITSVKTRRPEDEEWLKGKRRKAQGPDPAAEISQDEVEEDEDVAALLSDDELSNTTSDDDMVDGFHGFGGQGDDDIVPRKRERENPYVAPVVKDFASVAKYVPPSLRGPTSSDEEMLRQLKRQSQGLLNRLSEANLLSILQSVEDLYAHNPRQHVTSTLVELLGGLITDPATLNDSFLILHAGFATAVYRVVGTDFGAQLLEYLVQTFDKFHNGSSGGKQTLNLLTFLSNLYTLQAIGCEIMFDYTRVLLENFSEANTELLLRVIRTSGTQLRQDDPTALKDIVLLLHRSIAKLGLESLSVRTKFMVETIQDLKNNRMKTGIVASALTTEHVQRMRKVLGSLGQTRHNIRATEPLRITLADLRDTQKKGKWWLVGASWKDSAVVAQAELQNTTPTQTDLDGDKGVEEFDNNVDLHRLAREQGMNTDVRRAIFISVAGAVDYKHAQERILRLALKSKQQIEIPRVLLHCIGAEPVYNHFYTLVATRFCVDHKLRKSWEFALLDLYRRMGETRDNENALSDDEEEDASSSMSVSMVFNTAKLYATLVANGLLRMTVLKTLDFATLKPKTRIFVETLIANVFLILQKKEKSNFEARVTEMFSQVTSEMSSGLQYYITKHMPTTDVVADRKGRKTVARGCEAAMEALNTIRNRGVVTIEDESDDDLVDSL